DHAAHTSLARNPRTWKRKQQWNDEDPEDRSEHAKKQEAEAGRDDPDVLKVAKGPRRSAIRRDCDRKLAAARQDSGMLSIEYQGHFAMPMNVWESTPGRAGVWAWQWEPSGSCSRGPS